jgi:glycosyltransferase involved in cell wall biosynthesis
VSGGCGFDVDHSGWVYYLDRPSTSNPDEEFVKSRPLFTVFTAAYNRAPKLKRPFSSLETQTYRNFEWLLVDDGSKDNTVDLIAKWAAGSSFPIRYFSQEHRGLHWAFNRGVEEARGEFLLPLDSDDALEPQAMERLLYHWESIPQAERRRFSGVCCLCRDETGRLIGDPFPRDVMDSDSLEITYRYRVRGQKGGFHRLDVMREFPFDETAHMGCNPWRRIARKYKMRFVNEVLEIYYQDSPEESLARSPKRLRPVTGLYRTLEILNREIDYMKFWPAEFYRTAMRYTRYSFHCGMGLLQQLRRLENPEARRLWAMAWPIGYLVYLQDRLRGRGSRLDLIRGEF